MARCMLCSSPAGEADVVCPRCGGALEDDPADATRVEGLDLTKRPGSAGPPPDGWGPPMGPPPEGWGPPTGPPPEGWGPPTGPPPQGWGPPTGPPMGPPPGQWGPMGPPPEGWGPPPGPYGPGYGAPPSLGGYGGGYPYGPAGYGPPGYGYPGFVPQPPIEGMAIGSLITSITGLVLAPFTFVSIVACPVGAVLGHVAMRRIDEQRKGGRGIALAGAIVGWVGTAFLALGLIGLAVIIVAAFNTGEY